MQKQREIKTMNTPPKPSPTPTGCIIVGFIMLCAAILGIVHSFNALSNATGKSPFHRGVPDGWAIEKNNYGYYRAVKTKPGATGSMYSWKFERDSYGEALDDAWRYYNLDKEMPEFLEKKKRMEDNSWKTVP